MAWLPLQRGSVHPSHPLSPCPACFASEPAPNPPRQGPRHPGARPEVGRGRPRQAESRVELSCIHRHVPARIPPQSCAWPRALSGDTRIQHQTDRLGKCIFQFSTITFLDALIPFCLCYLFQNLPGVELHRQRFLWAHTESERQGQTKDICCQSQSSTRKHNHLYCYYNFLICIIHQVIPKAEILRLGVLEQSKEEVIIQVGIQNCPCNVMTQNVS